MTLPQFGAIYFAIMVVEDKLYTVHPLLALFNTIMCALFTVITLIRFMRPGESP